MEQPLLHPSNLQRIPLFGDYFIRTLETRVGELTSSVVIEDPNVSVVIRSRNNVAGLEGLLEDISIQDFAGEIETVVVDSESRDGSKQLARHLGATVVSINQEDYSHAKALNLGFEASTHEWVFALVEHSLLSHRSTLKVASRYDSEDNVAGAGGSSLPNANASRTELIASGFYLAKLLSKSSRALARDGMGLLPTNTSAIRRSAWEEVGGFDELYGSGGEDGALCRALLKAGHQVIYEPAMSVYHSHGLGPINSLRQLKDWSEMGSPRDFDINRILKYRSDIQSRES